MKRILSFMGSNREFMAYLKGLKQRTYFDQLKHQPKVVGNKEKNTP